MGCNPGINWDKIPVYKGYAGADPNKNRIMLYVPKNFNMLSTQEKINILIEQEVLTDADSITLKLNELGL